MANPAIAHHPLFRSKYAPLNCSRRSFRIPGSAVGFSELIVQSNGAVLVRIPVNQPGKQR